MQRAAAETDKSLRAYANDPEIRHEMERLKDAIAPDAPVLWLGTGAERHCAPCWLAQWPCGWPDAPPPRWRPVSGCTSHAECRPAWLAEHGNDFRGGAELVEVSFRNGVGPRILVCDDRGSKMLESGANPLPYSGGPRTRERR